MTYYWQPYVSLVIFSVFYKNPSIHSFLSSTVVNCFTLRKYNTNSKLHYKTIMNHELFTIITIANFFMYSVYLGLIPVGLKGVMYDKKCVANLHMKSLFPKLN